jgi:hypothetical protein
VELKKYDAAGEIPFRADLWYYCVHLSENFISIEVSRPNSELGGYKLL